MMGWNDNQVVQGGIGGTEGEPNGPKVDVDSLLSREADASRTTRKAALRRLGRGGAGMMEGLASPSSSPAHLPTSRNAHSSPTHDILLRPPEVGGSIREVSAGSQVLQLHSARHTSLISHRAGM